MWVAYIMKFNRCSYMCARYALWWIINPRAASVIGERRRWVIDRNLCSCFLVLGLMYLRALFATHKSPVACATAVWLYLHASLNQHFNSPPLTLCTLFFFREAFLRCIWIKDVCFKNTPIQLTMHIYEKIKRGKKGL